ncbi:hypothetical protein [Amycolatopsis sp. 195334CR]|nr:hypothetical protein [Amycolatopsis sp. 195334CR]MBN6034779.1 hypothetical protein [Amycolatopsis sp. 195334CR]
MTALEVVLAGGSELFNADGCPLDVDDLDAAEEVEFVRSTEPPRAAGCAE